VFHKFTISHLRCSIFELRLPTGMLTNKIGKQYMDFELRFVLRDDLLGVGIVLTTQWLHCTHCFLFLIKDACTFMFRFGSYLNGECWIFLFARGQVTILHTIQRRYMLLYCCNCIYRLVTPDSNDLY
jgi:hypothetical protein